MDRWPMLMIPEEMMMDSRKHYQPMVSLIRTTTTMDKVFL
jgi:hypothetical protein